MIKLERTAMIKEGIGSTVHDAHHDNFMIEIKYSPADRPDRIPQRWQIAHGVSLKPSYFSGQSREPASGRIVGMYPDARAGGTEPDAVQLHLHRGIGWGIYGTATTVVLVLVLAGAVSNLSSGRLVTGAVIAIVGLPLSAFLALLTYSIVVPSLTVNAARVSGRLSWRGRIDVDWNEITIDLDDEAPPGTLRLSLGEESVSVSGRSWVGFREFIILVASTPQAAVRLTPAARTEVRRLLHIDG